MMTGNKLMGAVLQLAMQGKIVEQRPEEGTGEELYQKIRFEKDRLIKRGIVKRSKKSEEISDDEKPFDIPESWKWVRVEDIAILNPKNDLEDDIDASFIPMSLVDDAFSNHHTSERRKWGEIKKGFSHFAEGDIGVAKITPCFQNRKSVIFKDLINGYGAGTTELSIVRPIKSFCSPDYLLYIFKSELFIKNGMKSFTGTAGQQRVHKDFLRKFLIPLPPLAEQKRIVAKIEELMPFVEQYADASTKLNTLNTSFPDMMKKSILQEAVQGKLVPQDPNDEPASVLLKKIAEEKKRLIKEGKIKKQKPLPEITEDEIPFDIPESWEWVRLEMVSKSITDGDHQAPPKEVSGIPFLVISNVSSGKIIFSDTRFVSEKYFDSLTVDRKAVMGDILFTVTGSYGIPVKVDTLLDFCFQRHIALIKPLMDKDYMHMVLSSPLVKKQCDATATGTAQKTVGLSALRNFVIPIPPIQEQKRILQKLNEIWEVAK